MLLRESLEHNIHYNKPPQEASTFHFTASHLRQGAVPDLIMLISNYSAVSNQYCSYQACAVCAFTSSVLIQSAIFFLSFGNLSILIYCLKTALSRNS